MKYLVISLLISGCATPKDWAYKNENPHKAEFKYKPKYKDQDYGHRSYGNQKKLKHKKKTKIKY